MKTILVLFGGCSTEYEVSLQSACAILGHMDARQYAPLPVGITREGQWRYFPGPLFHLETGDWQDQPACVPCTLSLDRGARQLLLSDGLSPLSEIFKISSHNSAISAGTSSGSAP